MGNGGSRTYKHIEIKWKSTTIESSRKAVEWIYPDLGRDPRSLPALVLCWHKR